jgi:hypothetical protein
MFIIGGKYYFIDWSLSEQADKVDCSGGITRQ